MIQEIINYTKYLKEESPQIFEEGLEPSKGLHIFVELDEEGNAINFPGEKGVDWDYYDGKEKSTFIKNITPYDLVSTYITMNKQKKFDKKQKIHSASPFAVAFNFNFNDEDKKRYGIEKKPINKTKNDKLIKNKRLEVIFERIPDYFDNTEQVFDLDADAKLWKNIFFKFLTKKLKETISNNPKQFVEINKYWRKIKEKEYCKIYVRNVDFKKYESIYNSYLNSNIFNKEDYNINIDNKTYSAIDFYTTFADKKVFLKHKTALFKHGISYRFSGSDAKNLNDFLNIKKTFPNPIPLFIDKNEFKNTNKIISIFKTNGKLQYSQILKNLFKDKPDIIFQKYYLLYFNRMIIEDFDFVSKFRYSLDDNNKYPKIKNLFGLKINNNELKKNYDIRNIFYFESEVVKTIFNNSLVKIKDDSYIVNYFGEVNAKNVIGGDPIYQMILKYRKAFYDYIYKSKTEAISSTMWDEIMWNSIMGDLRNTDFDNKYYTEQSIKEKLNIWFSLYNYFTNNLNRTDMASKIPELLEKMKKVANDDNAHFDTTEEFAFGAGQIIYFLLNQSKASERTHALLEPFIQKVKAEQLQSSIAQTINMYKHEISFGHGRFERLSSEVLAFETDENLKNHQRLLLAGYFATPVIYEKKEIENN
jgi:CRISPR-associated protein Csh1